MIRDVNLVMQFHLRDRYGNHKTKGGDELKVHLRKPTRKAALVVDNGDGTYLSSVPSCMKVFDDIRYDITYPKGIESGEYEVVAELKGKPVNLPLTVQVDGMSFVYHWNH
jgi:hypothetical protein